MVAEELTVFVLFRRGIATYLIGAKETTEYYEAQLLSYTGNTHNLPPPRIAFLREGRHCSGTTEEQDLMDDLYDAVQRKKVGEGGDVRST